MAGVNERTGQAASTRTDTGKPSAGMSQAAIARLMKRRGEESKWWWVVPTLYIVFLMLPIYWLINMSFKTNTEIISSLTLYPHQPTLRNYRIIFTDAAWY